jgi:O-methyltransferase
MDSGARLYLDLLKRTLINEIGAENELRLNYVLQCAKSGETVDKSILRAVRAAFPERYERLLAARRRGSMLPAGEPTHYGFSDTLIGLSRLDQLEEAISNVVRDGIPGDIIECGVWRGGASIFARGVLAALGVTDRKIWVADSFAGLPAPSHEIDSDLSKLKELAIPLEQVKHRFERYGLLDNQVDFIPGWFGNTLAGAPVERLSILRADADIFSSTVDILSALYPRLSSGGYVIFDDYGAFPDCRAAVHAYRARHGIQAEIQNIDGIAVFWRKV